VITDEQSVVLASIERAHGAVQRIPDESLTGQRLLGECVSDTRAYQCQNCELGFTIEPDGETLVWVLVD
jgi:hypothetical protein